MYSASVSRRSADVNGDGSTLAAYLRQIARLPRLSVEEERALGSRIRRDHDEAAVSRLVESNLRFVVSCAKRYRGSGVSLLDLIHEGNLGLIEAARRFDPARNVKFISYAVWWVRQAMMHVTAEETRAFSFPPKLWARLGHRDVDVSLSDPIDSGERDGRAREVGDTLVQDDISVDDALIRQRAADDLSEALDELDGKEREIVRLRFGLEDDEPRTLQEIGDRLHLSRERVRQIESRAKNKLRNSARLRSHLN